jgi:hypothetical protein
VFAALLTSSYHSSFADQLSPETKAALGPATVEQFNDPTLPLNPGEYALVRKEVLALDGGAAILQTTTAAQREAVSVAIRDIFTGATGVAILCIGLAMLIKEVPLRRDFRPVEVEVAPVEAMEPLVSSSPVFAEAAGGHDGGGG